MPDEIRHPHNDQAVRIEYCNMIPRARANFFEGHAGAARSANVCTESCNHSLRRCKEIRMDAEDARAADEEFGQTAGNKDDCDDIYSN
jgi:hypothetical protein